MAPTSTSPVIEDPLDQMCEMSPNGVFINDTTTEDHDAALARLLDEIAKSDEKDKWRKGLSVPIRIDARDTGTTVLDLQYRIIVRDVDAHLKDAEGKKALRMILEGIGVPSGLCAKIEKGEVTTGNRFIATRERVMAEPGPDGTLTYTIRPGEKDIDVWKAWVN